MHPLMVSALMWGSAGVATGWFMAQADWKTLRKPGLFTRLRPHETRKFYERVLFVRVWKDRLPEAGTWFGGISKRHLPRAQDGGLARFAAESLRAERVHLLLSLVIPLSLTWSRGWWMFGNIAFGVVVNVPCIVVARYNRIRIARIA